MFKEICKVFLKFLLRKNSCLAKQFFLEILYIKHPLSLLIFVKEIFNKMDFTKNGGRFKSEENYKK